jgi:mycothiol synthase
MSKFISRTYAGDADLIAIVKLMDECEAVDQLEDTLSIDELRLELAYPQRIPERDLRLWFGPNDALIAIALMEAPDNVLSFKIHPSARMAGEVESQIIAWGEEYIGIAVQERNVSAEVYSWIHDADTARQRLMEYHGFTVRRHWLCLACSLDNMLPEPHLPQGFTLRTVTESDAETWVELYNDSFVDHWDYHPWTIEMFRYWLTDPEYLSSLNLIAVDPDGTFSAFCWSDISSAENTRSGRNEGWISLLGTRRGYRKIGLGRALLLAGMQRLQHEGVITAKLNVDAENLTGASRLYTAVGFHSVHTWMQVGKCVHLSHPPIPNPRYLV